MSEYMPEASPMRSRGLGTLRADADDTVITVEHVYLPEGAAGTCCEPDCDGVAHDPGMVGVVMADDEDTVCCLLSAAEALTLANRLTRAASLVLESEEQVPDVEREAARFGAPS